MASRQNERSVITGVVVASRWRKDGTVSGISIQGYDQKEYVVRLNKFGRLLLGAVRKVVRVTGKVSPAIDGRRTIKISQLELKSDDGVAD